MKYYGKSIRNKRDMLRASSLPELLVAMVLSGLVLFFAYEGTGMIMKRLGLSGQEHGQWQLLQSHALLERLMMQADSVVISGECILFYSSGIPSDTLTTNGKSVIYKKNGIDEILFSKATLRAEKFLQESCGAVRCIDIHLPGTGKDTLHLSYHTGSSGYVEMLYSFQKHD